MRVLITGADGQLGVALQQALVGHTLVPFVHPEFDLLGAEVEKQIRSAEPDVVIHAAAYTDVDRAEQEPERAMMVNAEGTERVARAAAAGGARLVYVSTDYVFDGRKTMPYSEADLPAPINVYGRSKLEGERRALARCPDTLVVRTSWLYGATGKNFVTTILSLARQEQELRMVDDQRGCPTYTRDLARAIASLTHSPGRGIVHIAGSGDCTWHEFACAILAGAAVARRVVPILSAELKRPAARPAYSVLKSTVLADSGIRMPHWQDGLARCLEEVGVSVRRT